VTSISNEAPEALNIDVDQWRREIRMFAESTEKAINAIVSDLSSSTARTGSGKANAGQNSSTARACSESVNGERLAELRAQIAKRLES